MNRWRKRVMWALVILAAGLLPVANVVCDFRDGEVAFLLPGIGYSDCYDCYDCYDCGGGDYYYDFGFWDYYW